MSRETERELQEQIDRLEADLKKKRSALEVIKNKPKFRLGDFGYSNSQGDSQDGRLVTSTTGEVSKPYATNIGSGTYQHNTTPYKWVGNIFDLLEEAGPDGVIVALTKDEIYGQLHSAGYSGCRGVDKKIKAALERKV